MEITTKSSTKTGISADTENYIKSVLVDNFSKMSEHITRLDLHVSEEGAAKKCVLEIRIAGKKPISISKSATTLHQSVSSTVSAAKRLLKEALVKQVEKNKRGTSTKHLKIEAEN